MPETLIQKSSLRHARRRDAAAAGGRTANRTVAMICYDWSVRIMGGSIRAISFARALPALGWDVLVITASPTEDWPEAIPGVSVHCIPSRERGFGGGISVEADESRLGANPDWLRRLASLKSLLPLERQLVWYPGFWRGAPRRCREVGVSAVLTIVAPNVMMPLGHHLARKLGVPHVIDLRDDFADRYRVEPITGSYQRLLSAYGHHYTRRAQGLCVVSPVTRERFAARGTRATLLMNGYVEGHFEGVAWDAPAVPAEGPLRLMHLGWLGNFRSAGSLVEALNGLPPNERTAVEFYHYGLIDPDQVRLLDSCRSRTSVHPQVRHVEAIRLMLDSDVLVAMPGDRLPAAMSGKLFEYLRSRRPILLVAGEGAARTLAREAGLSHVVHPDDVEGIRAAVRSLLKLKRAGSLRATSDPRFVRSLNRTTGTRILASLLDEVAP